MLLFPIPTIAHVWLIYIQPGHPRVIPQTFILSSLQEVIKPSWRQILVSVSSYFFEVDFNNVWYFDGFFVRQVKVWYNNNKVDF